MATFAELTKRVHSINDLILSDMVSVKKNYTEESVEFRSRVLVTTNWFSRISWTNKKRFVLALLGDVRSVWTLSLLLKSIWNCRPKDAVLSVCQPSIWSSYDQVPMDHNRTALPLSTLKEVMTRDRKWFMSLVPESQAILLCELLTISGGPIMWEVLQRAQEIYETYIERELKNLQECNVVIEAVSEKVKPAPEPLDANLAAWNANIKSMRDRMKLEEVEMVFSDGSKKKFWKVNRPKPETTETVDFVQLLPSEIGKRILLYLPATQLSDCARVNKYWSYLVDELKSELITRQKINIELEKFKETMLRHDTSLDLLARPEFQLFGGNASATECSKKIKTQTSTRLSTKTNALSFRLAAKKDDGPLRMLPKPITTLAELSERLQRRGAADENLWRWCENLLTDTKHVCGEEVKFQPKKERLQAVINNFAKPCAKNGADVYKLMAQLADASLPRNDDVNEFLYCFGKAAGYTKDDGHLKIDNIVRILGDHPLVEKMKESLRKCDEITKENPIETVIAMNDCIAENAPVRFVFSL